VFYRGRSMTAVAKRKSQKSVMGLVSLCCVLLAGIFAAVFISANNITVSFETFSSSEKYPAQAFVAKRTGRLKPKIKTEFPSTDITTASGFSAQISFDTTEQKVRFSLRDQNDKPVSRVTVVGAVSRVGQKRIARQFKILEYNEGQFSSPSLKLDDGGWILMVSAYDLYTRERNKLLFHTERAIFLGGK